MALVTPLEFEWREWRLREGRYKGYDGPRPAHFPTLIPPLWWVRLAAFLLRRKLARQEASMAWWRGKQHFAVAWTNRSPDEVAAHVKELGGDTLWVQANAGQTARAAEWRAAADAHGLGLAVWAWGEPEQPEFLFNAVDKFSPDAVIVNVEHKPGAWGAYPGKLRAKYPTMPLGLWTNFWGAGATTTGYDKAQSKPWIDAGFMCITESYMWNEEGYQPTLNPYVLDWTAKVQLGYPETIPSYGVYRCGPDLYAEYMTAFPGYAWYLYETYPGGA